MLIYLDTCSIQRPIDDRSQLRINMEAEAIITVLHMIETGEIDLLSSEILEFEISKIPSMNRKHRASEIINTANINAKITSTAIRINY